VDNGRGFKLEEVWGRDPASRGLGLIAMEERARMLGGILKIKSQEGHGTQLSFTIPVTPSEVSQDVKNQIIQHQKNHRRGT
jgi:signal transduction histidine kinase